MEPRQRSSSAAQVELSGLFSDLVRLETDVWDLVDHRLRSDHDLPLSWFEPMQVMDSVVECRVGDIAETLSITVGGVSKLVDRIEQAGWCGRSPNPRDGRSSVLTLTKAGQRTLRAARVSLGDELAALLGVAASPDRLATFASILRDLRQHIACRQGSVR